MRAGHIYVADYEGTYVIRLVGDVRLTLCISFDQFIASMFAEGDAKAIIFDLRKAQGIDSTTLGLMAKISIGARARGLPQPVVVTASESIVRLMVSMGFDDIFDITDEQIDIEPIAELPLNEVVSSESEIKRKVLEAHRILMALNDNNQIKFQELVETLQNNA